MSCPAQSSGLKSADAVISALPCRLKSLQVIADGTNAATVILYDNASAASGTAIAKVSVPAGETFEYILTDVVCNSGIYADVTGTGAGYIVHFSLGS